MRASFRLSEVARAAAKQRASHGHLLPLRPSTEGTGGGQGAPKPPAPAPAAADPPSSAGSSSVTYSASGGKRTEGGGYGYRAYGYAGSYGSRPGQPDHRPAAPLASSRGMRLQSRPPPVLSGRRRYPGELDAGGGGSSPGAQAAGQANHAADRAARRVGALLPVVAGGGVRLTLTCERRAAAELPEGGHGHGHGHGHGPASEIKGGRAYRGAVQEEGRQPVGTSISGGWRLLASCLLCGRNFLNGGARSNHARSCRGSHRPVRLELEPGGGGGVRVALAPQRLADQQPRELALWAGAEGGAKGGAQGGAQGGAEGGAEGGGACGYRGVVRLAPDPDPLTLTP